MSNIHPKFKRYIRLEPKCQWNGLVRNIVFKLIIRKMNFILYQTQAITIIGNKNLFH